jgi:hypothetical protein
MYIPWKLFSYRQLSLLAKVTITRSMLVYTIRGMVPSVVGWLFPIVWCTTTATLACQADSYVNSVSCLGLHNTYVQLPAQDMQHVPHYVLSNHLNVLSYVRGCGCGVSCTQYMQQGVCIVVQRQFGTCTVICFARIRPGRCYLLRL